MFLQTNLSLAAYSPP